MIITNKEKDKKNETPSLFSIIFGTDSTENNYSRKREDKNDIYDFNNPDNCSEREYDDDDDYDDYDEF